MLTALSNLCADNALTTWYSLTVRVEDDAIKIHSEWCSCTEIDSKVFHEFHSSEVSCAVVDAMTITYAACICHAEATFESPAQSSPG